ncbi:MAG: CBS domain-containing protein [Chitinispirillaceae bacterium]|nr:CBS domain-containing protein [Chitinispirillaceae bacterium]
MIFFVPICVVCVLFFCSVSRAALRYFSVVDLEHLKNHHPLIGKSFSFLHKNSLLTITTLYTLELSFVVFGAFYLTEYLPKMPIRYVYGWIIIYIIFLALVGIALPEIIAKRFKETFVFVLTLPVFLIVILFYPLNLLIKFFDFLTNGKDRRSQETLLADIISLARNAESKNIISRMQLHLIEQTVKLSNIKAKDIMVSREKIHTIPVNFSLAEALIEAHKEHHTRFPLIDRDIDHVIGYVNFKDIVSALRINPADPSLNGIKRSIEYVNPDMPLPELLGIFTRGFQRIVIVKDKENKTIGMITLEDLIETLIGSIGDEYDNPPDFIVQITENRYRIGGGVTFEKLKKRISNELPEWDLTVSEWISAQCEDKLTEQKTFSYHSFKFIVRKIVRNRVFDLFVEKEEIQK